MDVDVSVIIPVYKVENYLRRCVESVLNQTFKNIEIILVDDGSPDSCGVICDEYKKLHSNVVVIHKENGGLSSARNAGLKEARGRYILFVDSDDYIDCFAIEKLYSLAVEYDLDIVEGGASSLKDGMILKQFVSRGIDENVLYHGEEYAIKRIQNHCFYAAVWLKLYKKEFLENNNLRFKDKRLHEDELWNPFVILNASRIMYLDYDFYYYDISRENSIMQNISKKNIVDIMSNCYELVDFYKSKKIEKKSKMILLDYVIKQYIMISLKCKQDLDWYKKQRSILFVFSNVRSLKMFIVAFIYAINIKLFVKLMGKT